MSGWPAPDPATVVEGLAAPVRAVADRIPTPPVGRPDTSARAAAGLMETIRGIEWRPWRLTSDRIAGTTIATSPRREVPGPTPGTPTAPPPGDAVEVVGGMPTISPSRAARRERDACRGVGRAPTRSDDGRQICGWCGQIVDVIGDRCGAHKRPQRVNYIASVRIGGRDG